MDVIRPAGAYGRKRRIGGHQMKETGQQNEKVTILDEAGALMEEEADWLESIATELSEKSGWNISVIAYKGILSYNDEYKN